ncbi:SRPBCC family protein [Oculatella sp. LEGE 06141]|uniref:SRPBCC family protein n=1 Tax=Oculatella sp. LEGE 06141 TaxID=1828648 RepID=UPI0018812C46|nr:SRPBCC family protein [Oculatella sp. LEGE 06141]MBE9181970.1 SRPBCC family protein [Oculatella sp. LEGE 06141]
MSKPISVRKTLTINRPVAELYRFWHNFEALPHFMKHLKEVKVYDDKRSHWITSGPLDSTIEWDAEIIEDRDNELIAWRSVAGADVDHSGVVRFRPTPNDRGTEVNVVTEYNPPAGAIGDAIAKLFGESPDQQLGDDLRRFKMLMETGEIATTEGQPKGHS